MTQKHWAAALIGKPWAPDGEGPDTFSCWGLVRWVFRHQYGVEMPAIRVTSFSEGENVSALRAAVQTLDFRPVEVGSELIAGDVVVMEGSEGRHCGVVIDTIRGLRFLHASGHMGTRGPVGSVVAQPLHEAFLQYWDIEPWRPTK